MERFENIWISTEAHLETFHEVKNRKHILKNAYDLTLAEKYRDFPRIVVGRHIFPVIFNNIGRLIISDDNIQIYIGQENYHSAYLGINKSDNIFISFGQIKDIEIVSYRTAIFKYFDNTWIKISYIDAEKQAKHLLLSHSGYGLVMKKIKRDNIELSSLLKRKIFKTAD